ncbi:MAG: aminotransferase class V-fold PLP-dependent enzyme [Candidatus Margulisbacteria bacterium]|jgi:selenocysteine lyase/cysteine desulfurase|nr:aminotransferase class V-fold PLP-dependent enzyme [Candidatus Margulisiibacteriota bacterium]
MLKKIIADLVTELREKTKPQNPVAEFSIPEILAKNVSLENKLEFLRGQLAGGEAEEITVFGHVRQLYADYTAQGKQLDFLLEYEKWFARRFGNTHTQDTLTADFSHTAFNSLIALIHKALRADPENYVVLPVGQGTSGALERLHKILGLDIAPAVLERVSGAERARLLELKKQINRFSEQKNRWEAQYKKARDKWLLAEIDALDEGLAAVYKLLEEWLEKFIPDQNRPVVLITGQEHHGNTLPYDGTLADKIIVPFVSGTVDIDLAHYEKLLQDLRAQGRKIIVSFSAASNVTGHLTDIQATAALAKKYGALTIYDHAASLAYEPIDLSPRTEDGRPLIDAVVASPHKLPGGPGSTGLLVFNKAIYPAQLHPTNKAGGTVWHVSLWDVEYSRDILERELSGTPNGIGVLRLGLAIDLTYNVIGFANIQKIERKLSEPLFDYLRGDPGIILYGDQELEKRAPIFSFNIRHDIPQGAGVLHPKFVARVLSDLFGIQTRPGCSCAGEYGHYLLEISEKASRLMQDKVCANVFAGKPGWVRLNPHWLFTPEQMSYIVEALKLLSAHGHKLLALYELDRDGGYRFKTAFQVAEYIDVNVTDAENVGAAQAAWVFSQRQLLNAQPKPAGSKYAYRRALLDQLENAEVFLNALPDNTDRLRTLNLEEHGAPLPLLYENLTPGFQDRLDELERRQFATPPAVTLASAASNY